MLNNNKGLSDLGQKYLENISSVFSVFVTWKGWNFRLVNILIMRSSGALIYDVGTIWSVTSEWPLIQRAKTDRIKLSDGY